MRTGTLWTKVGGYLMRPQDVHMPLPLLVKSLFMPWKTWKRGSRGCKQPVPITPCPCILMIKTTPTTAASSLVHSFTIAATCLISAFIFLQGLFSNEWIWQISAFGVCPDVSPWKQVRGAWPAQIKSAYLFLVFLRWERVQNKNESFL